MKQENLSLPKRQRTYKPNTRLYKNKYAILITTNDYLELPINCFLNVSEASMFLNIRHNTLHSILSRVLTGERTGNGADYNIRLVEMEEKELIELLEEEHKVEIPKKKDIYYSITKRKSSGYIGRFRISGISYQAYGFTAYECEKRTLKKIKYLEESKKNKGEKNER